MGGGLILRKSGACYLLMHEGRAVSKELDDLIADNERLQLSRTKVRATVEIEGEGNGDRARRGRLAGHDARNLGVGLEVETHKSRTGGRTSTAGTRSASVLDLDLLVIVLTNLIAHLEFFIENCLHRLLQLDKGLGAELARVRRHILAADLQLEFLNSR